MEIIRLPVLEAGARLTAYLHDNCPDELPNRLKRPALVICPGGGYEFLSRREFDPPAMAFFSRGYQVFVLEYSVAPKEISHMQPLQEISASVALIRKKARAEEWAVFPDQIAVLGFSAGGHLAASLSVYWNHPDLLASLSIEPGENKPNAAILCYPVITAGEFAHRSSIVNISGSKEPGKEWDFWSLEKHVTKDTPPTFLWHTVSDPAVPVENSLLYAAALQKHHIPFECHLFAEGNHGLSTCDEESNSVSSSCRPWVDLALRWLGDRFCFSY